MAQTNLFSSHAISPIDGRYHAKTEEIAEVSSEFSLMLYRTMVEIEYLIALQIKAMGHKPLVRELNEVEINALRRIYLQFDDDDFSDIKKFEKITNHDVKAVEYFIKDRLKGSSLEDISVYVHYGKTSEDINNLAYALMLAKLTNILYVAYSDLHADIWAVAQSAKNLPMLSLTHGQPASPTTLGWEMKVYEDRLKNRIEKIKNFVLPVKWNGATGGDNALKVAHPGIDWRRFSKHFIEYFDSNTTGMKFTHCVYTTQIEPHDSYAELFGLIQQANNVLLDFSRDMWGYISREVFIQRPKNGEIGSSAMPQKINPINFENAEGNLGVANALFNFFSNKLPISRFQRDLSDSTVERYFGQAYACTLIALKSLRAGWRRLLINEAHLKEELNNNWAVISEGYQNILKREGITDGYELLLELTRGKKITERIFHDFVDRLLKNDLISNVVAKELKSLTPHNYIGDRTF